MKKVMIIDDELDILHLLEKFLTKTNKFSVEIHSNPDIALKKIEENRYDVIVSDIMMPSTDGMDILKTAKEKNPSVKVILMTAYNSQHKIEKSNELGVDAYLEKPFSSLKIVEETILTLI